MSEEYGNAQTVLMAFLLLRYALMVYAAWHDARTRTFPNTLAVVFALVCAYEAFLCGGLTDLSVPDGMGGLQEGGFLPKTGFHVLAVNAGIAFAVFIALFAFELLWRHFRKEPGLGIGDLKFLSALMLVEPVKALIAFALGLVALALTGLLTKKRSLPLLPFIVGSYFAIIFAGCFITFGM